MASKAFLRELRRKHGLGEFSKKSKSKRSRRSLGDGNMARKKKGGFRRKKSSGLMGTVVRLIPSFLAGAVAPAVKERTPIVKDIQLPKGASGLLVGGLMKRDLGGVFAGVAGEYLLGDTVRMAANQAMGASAPAQSSGQLF